MCAMRVVDGPSPENLVVLCFKWEVGSKSPFEEDEHPAFGHEVALHVFVNECPRWFDDSARGERHRIAFAQYIAAICGYPARIIVLIHKSLPEYLLPMLKLVAYLYGTFVEDGMELALAPICDKDSPPLTKEYILGLAANKGLSLPPSSKIKNLAEFYAEGSMERGGPRC